MESQILEFIGIDPGIIFIIMALLMLLLFIYMVKISFKMTRFLQKYKQFMRGKDGVSLEKSFLRSFAELDMLMESSKNHMEEIRKLKEVQSKTFVKTDRKSVV